MDGTKKKKTTKHLGAAEEAIISCRGTGKGLGRDFSISFKD